MNICIQYKVSMQTYTNCIRYINILFVVGEGNSVASELQHNAVHCDAYIKYNECCNAVRFVLLQFCSVPVHFYANISSGIQIVDG